MTSSPSNRLLLILSVALPLAGAVLSETVLGDWRLPLPTSHSVIELLGGLISIIILGCILFGHRALHMSRREAAWVASALASMGLFDLFHAVARPGNNFVWFHSLATLSGGVFFAGVWTRRLPGRLARHLPFVAALVTILLSGWSALFPDLVPAMTAGGSFTPLARALNVGGGAGFILATIYFLRRHASTGHYDSHALAAHCLLFGVAGVLFEVSSIWDASWWWWHVLRLAAYLVLAAVFVRSVRSEFSNPARTLRGRILLLACGIAVSIPVLVGALSYRRAVDATLDLALSRLAGETGLIAARFAASHDELKNDAHIVADTPPIHGLIRSVRNDGLDPLDRSTTELWRSRLEAIFISVMRSRPHYTQLRYIGVADNARELVRVNRVGDSLEAVPLEELQEKGGEPYIRSASTLWEDQVYFSPVTPNRECGVVEEELIYTLRAVVPVSDASGERFGFLVVNTDYEETLRAIFDAVRPDDHTFIVNHSGDFVEYRPWSKELTFHFRGDGGSNREIVSRLQSMEEDEGAVTGADFVDYLLRVDPEPGRQDTALGVAVRVPREQLLADVNETRREALLLTIALAIASVFVAAWTATELTRPLMRMTKSIRDSRGDVRRLNLPLSQRDEIGQLAQAFTELAQDLSDSEKRAKAVLDNTLDAVFTIDEMGTVSSYNPACERVFGYEASEVIGQNVKVLMPGPHTGDHDGHLQRNRESGVKAIVGALREVEARRKDGSTFSMELSVSETRLEGNSRLFTGIARDISSRRAAEVEREALIDSLEQSNRELDEFAYVASHDLKAPLRAIDHASHWLEEDLAEHLDENSKESMRLLRNRAARMERLLDDLLAYGRIGRSTDPSHTEVIDGSTLAEDLSGLLAVPDGFRLRFSQEFEQVEVHRMPLQQVLLNLIGNAVKHHDRTTGSIEVDVEDRGDRYMLRVTDDGPGVAPQHQEQVFKMFQTLRPRDQVEGSGMGLAMVKKHVEHFGGTIRLESEEGRGCRFEFTWPKRQPDRSAVVERGEGAVTRPEAPQPVAG